MSVIDGLEWAEVERLIAMYGGEEHIAERIKVWRKERGWTLKDLGDRVHLSPAAVHKIENRAGAGGRRRNLTVSEAISFAKAFEKPLGEMLLPDLALLELEGWERFKAAADALNEARYQWRIYCDEMDAARFAVAENPLFRARIEEYLAVVEQSRRDQLGAVWVNSAEDEGDAQMRERMLADSPHRLPNDAEDAYDITPGIAAARAALSEEPLPQSILSPSAA